jgi:hypothetical protein
MYLPLGEAVLLGSILMEHPAAGRTTNCAIGMALLAHSIQPNGTSDYGALKTLYPWLRQSRSWSKCPRCGVRLRFTGRVAHVFDRHVIKEGFSFEAFCQWLVRIETKYGLSNKGLMRGSETQCAKASKITAPATSYFPI